MKAAYLKLKYRVLILLQLPLKKNPIIDACEGVYSPSEDTFLLGRYIECRGNVLEIGTGSGYLGIGCALSGSNVTATDISSEALECASRNARNNGVNITFLQSDLYQNVSGRFDEIIFNPPYLPAEDGESEMWSGGKDGLETVRRFLLGSRKHLCSGGIIEIILSDLSDIVSLTEQFSDYEFHMLGKETFQFETIFAYTLNLREMR